MFNKLLNFTLFFLIFATNVVAVEKVSLQLMWKHQFQFAGYYMAKEKGFYKRVGLDVNIKEYTNNIKSVDDVLEHKSDFGVGRSSLIYDRLEGKSVVMLAAIFQHSPIILLSKKREDLQTLSDFKNKSIMLSTDHLAIAPINAMLISSGIKNDMYTSLPHTFNVSDLIHNKTDAILAYVSNEPYMMKEANIEYSTFSPKEFGFDFYSDILFTSESLVKNSPITVDNFRNASLEGWKYAMQNPNEAIALILKKYNTQNKSEAALHYEAESMIDLIDAHYIPLGSISKNRVENIAKTYRLMGFITKNRSMKNLIYSANDTSSENFTPTFDVNIFSKKIVPLLQKPLYNIDTEELPSILNALISENQNIQAISLKESLDKETVFSFYRDSDNAVFNEKIPSYNLKNKSKKVIISYKNEEVGELTLYYKNNLQSIMLTENEQNWINTHTVKIGIEQWDPVVFSTNG